jgi:hypothetical protein
VSFGKRGCLDFRRDGAGLRKEHTGSLARAPRIFEFACNFVTPDFALHSGSSLV